MKNVIVVFALLVFLLDSCVKEAPLGPLPPDTQIPTLSWPIASFATVTRFFPFGDTLIGNPANKGYEIILTDTAARLLSACSGFVTSITPNGNGTNTILIKPKKNSIYSIVYAGIGRVQVTVNDSVAPGSILGVIAPVGMINFSLIRNNTVALCPASAGSQDFNTSIQVAISRNNIISPEDTVSTPCIADSLAF